MTSAITLAKSFPKRLGVKASDQLESSSRARASFCCDLSHTTLGLKGIVPKPAKSISVETVNRATRKMGRP